MRMFGPDLVLFVVGALMLGGATYGLIVTPPAGSAGGDSNLGLYKVSWKEATNESDGGRFTEGGAAIDATTNVTGTNLGKIIFSLDCKDPSPAASAQPFRYSFEVHMVPEGVTKPEAQTGIACGKVTEIEVPIQAKPADTQISSGTLERAKTDAANLGNATGSGDYHFKLSGARGQSIPVGALAGANVAITVKVVSYTPDVTAVTITPK